MQTIEIHLFALRLTFDQLATGKYWTYLIPSVLITLVFGGVFWLISLFFNILFSVSSIPLIGSYLAYGMESTASFVDWMLTAFYQFFILTILSPVNALLSEKVDLNTTNQAFKTGISRFLADIWRAILVVLVSFFFYLLAVSVWWIFTKITGFHLLDQIVYFGIAAFFIGFSFYDYSLERYQIKTKESWDFGIKNSLTMLVSGALFSLLFMVPRIGVLLAPFILTIVTTLVYLKMENRIPDSDTKMNTDV